MGQDERNRISRPIAESCLLAREIGTRPDVAGSPDVLKLFVFAHADLGSGFVHASERAIGHLRDVTLAPERDRAWGLPFQAIDELWFQDEHIARQVAVMLAAQAVAGAVVVLTNEVPLFEVI